MSVMIPADYWLGTNTVDLEYPWITPEAICELDKYIRPYHNVLEFGSGGSTLYFARRCNKIISYESLPDWYNKMKIKLVEKDIGNVDLRFVKTETECADQLRGMSFNIALIDCVEISRVTLAKLAASLIVPGGIIIVDNYAASYCDGIDDFLSMKCPVQHAYNDLHWAGNGTKIYNLVNNI